MMNSTSFENEASISSDLGAAELNQCLENVAELQALVELREAALQKSFQYAKGLNPSNDDGYYALLKIIIWKNMTIKQRRKTQFLLLLLQIFIWFGIACFSLATRSGRLEYIAEPYTGETHLIPRLRLKDLQFPIAVARNVSQAQHDGFEDKEFKNIMRDWARYYRATYKNSHPPIRLFSSHEQLLSNLRDDRRISFGIYMNSLNPPKYTLMFWEKEIPVTDEFNSFDCRSTLSEWKWGVCQMDLYCVYGFLMAQASMNTAIMNSILRQKGGDKLQLQLASITQSNYINHTLEQTRQMQKRSEPEERPSQSLLELNQNHATQTSGRLNNDELGIIDNSYSFLEINTGEESSSFRIQQPNRFRLELPRLSLVAERFPEHKTIRSQAAESAGSAPFYFMFALVSVFSFVVMDMVMEKESKMKEIMKTYGLSSGVFWLSWLLTYCILNIAIVWVAMFVISISGVFGPVTSLLVVLLLIYSYLLSLITSSFVVSIFFHKSQTATIAGMAFNLLLYFLGWMVHHTRIATSGLRIVFMLFSTITFSLSITDLIEMLPDGGVTLVDLFNFKDHDIGLHLIMLCTDTILYFVLAWYLDEVVQRDWGSTKHWTFIFGYSINKIKKIFQFKKKTTIEESTVLKTVDEQEVDAESGEWVEQVSNEVKASGLAVKIRGLVKRFPGKERMKTVVNHLNLDIYAGEIFGLLGHNGAGKTTTISMLTGMLQVDEGEALIMGNSIRTKGDAARKLISVCPQQNSFFEDLTCLEHLVFFAALRGIDVTQGLQQCEDQLLFNDLIVQKRFLIEQRGKIVDALANLGGKTFEVHRSGIVEMEKHFQKFGLSLFADAGVNYVHSGGRSVIKANTWEGILAAVEKVGLSEKMFSLPRMLSGGMKRRFWLVIALIGDPKVLFLDEPTSGVDPLGRQELWRLIQDEKAAGRCIIITTHHMEEADILADRKGIMTAGSLRCVGTSLFLKSRFGIGYYLEVELAQKQNIEVPGARILQFIQGFISSARRHVDDSKGSASAMAAARKNLLLFSLPLSSVDKFSALFKQLEMQKRQLGVLRYGISLSTLEEVFFKLGDVEMEEELAQEEAAQHEQENVELQPISDIVTGRRSSAIAMEPTVLPSGRRASELQKSTSITTSPTELQGFYPNGTRGDLVSQKFQRPKQVLFWKHLWAVISLRGIQIAHNKMNFFVDVLFPVITLVTSLFLREGGPGGLNLLATKPDTIFAMNDYSRFNQTIIIDFDYRLSPAALSQAYEIVQYLPPQIKKLLQLVNTGFSHDSEEIEPDEALIAAGLNRTQSTANTVLLEPEISQTPLNGQNIRNYLWHMKNKNIFKSPREFSGGLSFEPRTFRATQLFSKYDAESLQLRIFWHAGISHSLPIFISAVSDAQLKFLSNKIQKANFPSSFASSTRSVSVPSTEVSTKTIDTSIRSKLPAQSSIETLSFPLMIVQPTFVTAMTYGMYVMLSLGLSSLPSRFGIQIMIDKFIGTKHAMIVMGLPFSIYWIGSFTTSYLAMLFANFCVCFFVAYFIPLFWSFAIVPVITCAIFYSASVLLWAYFLSQIFGNLKAYAMTLQLTSMLLCLCPAYIVSVFSDAAMTGAKWGFSMLGTHIIFSVLFPAYNPIGVLIGCAVVAAEAHHAGIAATLKTYFDLRKMPIWCVIGSAVQAILLFSATVWIDYRHYNGKKSSRNAVQLLELIYQRRQEKRMQWLERRGGNQFLIPASLQDHKDADVLAEEFECMKIHRVLKGQERLYAKVKSEEERKALSNDFQIVADEDPSFPEELPLVLVDDLHYLFESRTPFEPPHVAVRGFSLSIYRGEIFGLLGPNGAGKSTSINLLTCNYLIAAPTRGTAFLGGHDVTQSPSSAFSHLGLCPQFDALWQDCTVKDNLRVFARIKNIKEAEIDHMIDKYIEDLELTQHQNKRISECSGGNKRRVSVAVAFLGDPDVVLMDEPSSGIDPVGRRRLAELIHRQSADRCVLITTHSMEEAEALCSRIGIIVNGELNCINTSLSIRNQYGTGVRLEVVFDESSPKYTGFDPSGNVRNPWQQFLATNILHDAVEVGKVANRLTYDIPLGSDRLGDLFDLMEHNKETFAIADYALSQPTLEQVFITFAKRQKSVQESMQEVYR